MFLCWTRGNYSANKFMLVQQSEPAHGANQVQPYVKDNRHVFHPKDILPSSSSDMIVSNFWLFGVVEDQSSSTSNSPVKSLKTAIKHSIRSLDDEESKRSCSASRQRISKVVEAKGDQI